MVESASAKKSREDIGIEIRKEYESFVDRWDEMT